MASPRDSLSPGDPDVSHRSNVVLTGFMGTGKTTVGRLLAERLDREFVDTDRMIERRHGSIPAIFESQGEPAFRRMEREVAEELAARRGVVVATGGRLLLDPTNAELLGDSGRVFCLVASVERVLERTRSSSGSEPRPLLAGPDRERRIRDLLAEREPTYARFEQVSTDDRSPAEVVDELIARLSEDRS